MKIWQESIGATGNEIDELVKYPLSDELDLHLSGVLSYEIELHRSGIKKLLAYVAKEWDGGIRDMAEDDNPPREKRNFNAFIKKGKHLKAGEAALILRYMDADAAEERAVRPYHLPGDFAEEIAMASLLQAAKHTEKADIAPALYLPIYREVQAMENSEQARRAWMRSLRPGSGFSPGVSKIYHLELTRKKHEEAAGDSLSNAYGLAAMHGFALSDAMKAYLDNSFIDKHK